MAEEQALKGFKKYFNSVTVQGRMNSTIAVYSILGVVGLYFYFKPKKTEKKAA